MMRCLRIKDTTIHPIKWPNGGYWQNAQQLQLTENKHSVFVWKEHQHGPAQHVNESLKVIIMHVTIVYLDFDLWRIKRSRTD